MVSSRFRFIALMAVVCMFLFYRSADRYDYRYPETKTYESQSPAAPGSQAEASGGYFDDAKDAVAMPTPVGGDGGLVPTQAAVVDEEEQETEEEETEEEAEQEKAQEKDQEPDRVKEQEDEKEKDAERWQDNQTSQEPKTAQASTLQTEQRTHQTPAPYTTQANHPAETTPSHHGSASNATIPRPSADGVDWSRFAYTQYVTNAEYLCNSVMMFETLHRLGSRPDRVMMYPQWMLDPAAATADTSHGLLLIKARDRYGVKLRPIEVQSRAGGDATWAESFTKLLAFNQTQYDRVLSLDSDGMVLQPMDELFLLPPAPVAMPRAYWLLNDDPPQRVLSSQLMLVQPDPVEFDRIMHKMDLVGQNDYDMEIVNQLYYDSALILPHRPYDMLTAEYRQPDHANYLGSDREPWDPEAALREAKFVHFSDWPVPKPWIPMSLEEQEASQPNCTAINGKESCVERKIWNKFYTNFADTRQRVCGSVATPIPMRPKRRSWLRM
ncbi:Glucose N-acetyltransferase 1 [Neonectria ditissima]|uniref:Glucose N-acetyltransferase 1 n=1 Tax=Neonectria ditissima TaxID=78410 RepID=A0A0P7BJN6_9HYPO|nr:Glucose N-acetyltransferase 1 [Neonectria ditissima]